MDRAFDFARDTTKQLISLATGFIALTITFQNDIVRKVSSGTKGYLEAAWILYLLSAVFGMLTLMALTGTLGSTSSGEEPSIYARGIQAFSIAQVVLFAGAITLTVVFGVMAL